MWETFIKIGLPNEIPIEKIVRMARSQVYSTVSKLKDKKIIDWFSFLIHNRESGVPITPDDENLYFHIRVSLKDGIKQEEFQKSLSGYCVMTGQPRLEDIDHITIDDKGTRFDTSLLKNEQIEEVWRILGEQSEWLLNTLNIYKDDVEIPLHHIALFLHYYHNMSSISAIVCPKCKAVIPL